MKEHILPAMRLTIACLLFFSGAYTLFIFGLAQLTPDKGKGDIIVVGNRHYYANIGQEFNEDKYFWSRPSVANYDATAGSGSNKGPFSRDYLTQVQARIDTFIAHNPGIQKSEIPSDLVTASGSGLDPDISVRAAEVQVKRIATIRNVSAESVKRLIEENKEGPLADLFGPEKVNVLKLNLALDQLK
jgi:potassium-transporting ATPase KdpC subunit